MATEPAIRPTPTLKRERQSELYQRALKSMPGGTDSNFRTWGEDTIYVDRGKGGRVWDIDENEYVDLRLGYGPVMLGHADPRVDDYVNERMRRGVSFSLTSEDEIRACELIKEITGWVEMARMTVSGTEATMHLMRIARAYTGREKIIKFEGQYHGVHDYALISVLPNDMDELGDRDNPVHLAWGRGIPEAVTQTVIPVPYNDLATLRRVFEAQGDDIAGVIIEPVLGNAQGILPKDGFHEGVRAITKEFGALLIFDEVKTGFRIARGGAAEYFGITPDLASFAKAIGNGYPGGGLRRQPRGDEHAARQGQPRRDVRRQPGRRGRRRGDPVDPQGRLGGRGDPAAGIVDPGRPGRDPRPPRACPSTSPACRRCSGSCSPARTSASTATGSRPTTTCTTPSPSGCIPGGRCPNQTRASRGSCARPTTTPTRPRSSRPSRARWRRRSTPGPQGIAAPSLVLD